MSSYLDMWTKIKELNLKQINEWINSQTPARGIEVNFRGVRVSDVDLLEALRNYREDLVNVLEN